MTVAAAITLVLSHVTFTGNDAVVFAKTALITAGVTTASWVLATFLTRPEPEKTLLEFYRRVHPTVYGWRKIALQAPEMPPVRDFASNTFDWVLGCLFVYTALFGTGKLIFGEPKLGFVLLLIATLSGLVIFWNLSSQGWRTLSGSQSNLNETDANQVVANAGE